MLTRSQLPPCLVRNHNLVKRYTARLQLTTSCRVPDPSSGRQICVVHVQLRRPWCLYVQPIPTQSKRRNTMMTIWESTKEKSLTGRGVVYLFIGCVLLGSNWYNYIPGTLVALTGLIYVALEFVPSIEPPANMRYVTTRRRLRGLRLRVEDANIVQGRGRRLGCRAGVRSWSIGQSVIRRSGEGAKDNGCFWKDQGQECLRRGARSFREISPANHCKKQLKTRMLRPHVEELGYEKHVERMRVWIRRTMIRLSERSIS